MKAKFRFYFFFLLLYLALAGLAYLITHFFKLGITFSDLSLLLTGALIITVFVFYIFTRGLANKKGKSVVYTLAAIGLKFILYLALLGIYALISNNLSIPFLISFFVIYLSFTSYLLITFVNLLKSNKTSVGDVKEN